jgi:hypothetical protein
LTMHNATTAAARKSSAAIRWCSLAADAFFNWEVHATARP